MLSPNGVTRSGLLLLAVAILGIAPSLQAIEAGSATDAAQLLADARTQSMQLAKDAQVLRGYTTGDLNLLIAGHGALMERIHQDVSRAGRLSLQMQSAKGEASAAQKEGMERVEPLLKELASILNAEVMRMRAVSTVVQMPPYADYLRANARLSSDLAWLIADVVDCADAKAKAEEIDRQIELINFD